MTENAKTLHWYKRGSTFPFFLHICKSSCKCIECTVRKIQKINCHFLTLFAFFLVLLPCSIYDHAEILTFDPVIALNVLSFRNENLHYRCTQCTLSLSPSIAEGDRTPLVWDGNVNHVRNVCHCRTWLLLVTTSNFLLDSWLKFRERRAVNHFSLPGNDTLSGTYLSLGLSWWWRHVHLQQSSPFETVIWFLTQPTCIQTSWGQHRTMA